MTHGLVCTLYLSAASPYMSYSTSMSQLNVLWLLQKKRMSSKPKAQVELGTQNNKSDVDYDWLPRETLQDLSELLVLSLFSSILVLVSYANIQWGVVAQCSMPCIRKVAGSNPTLAAT